MSRPSRAADIQPKPVPKTANHLYTRLYRICSTTGLHAEQSWRGQKRTNDTHASVTDSEADLPD